MNPFSVVIFFFALQDFTALYRDKLSDLNMKGSEMSDNYREILVMFVPVHMWSIIVSSDTDEVWGAFKHRL